MSPHIITNVLGILNGAVSAIVVFFILEGVCDAIETVCRSGNGEGEK